jgi:mRNA-degrading endonuclease RelE of RelBE toxin-antitoxin system
MTWKIETIGKVKKQVKVLPDEIRYRFYDLIADLRANGAILPYRPHFGKIHGKKDAYHCHLNKGHPTYVVCWRLNPKNEIEIIEVYYVGTHENAPY